MHHRDSITDGERFVVIVGDVDRRGARRRQHAGKFVDEPLPKVTIERPERLVEEEDIGARSEGAGERDALRLAARKGRDRTGAESLEADEREQLGDASLLGGTRLAAHPESERDVLLDGAMREQGMVLEHHPDRPASGRRGCGVSPITSKAMPNAHMAMEPGMITSIEPGIYRPGKWGVRIENLVLNVPSATNEFGLLSAGPGAMSLSSRVPATVPSETQSSSPLKPS